jgi:uncharacterized cupin superfamily protein
MVTMTDEARIEETPTGRQPADDGWYVMNLAEIGWRAIEGAGIYCDFSPRSPMLGIGVHVLHPGEPNARYHFEHDEQEDFLVLHGEVLLVVEGEERRLKQWDVFHCPPGTAHITIGAGDGPCAILMAGTRGRRGVTYPVDPVAARHGASVEVETDEPAEAYAGDPANLPAASPWPLA